jgi:hypothetical protein
MASRESFSIKNYWKYIHNVPNKYIEKKYNGKFVQRGIGMGEYVYVFEGFEPKKGTLASPKYNSEQFASEVKDYLKKFKVYRLVNSFALLPPRR